jgi:hypothetical protein
LIFIVIASIRNLSGTSVPIRKEIIYLYIFNNLKSLIKSCLKRCGEGIRNSKVTVKYFSTSNMSYHCHHGLEGTRKESQYEKQEAELLWRELLDKSYDH